MKPIASKTVPRCLAVWALINAAPTFGAEYAPYYRLMRGVRAEAVPQERFIEDVGAVMLFLPNFSGGTNLVALTPQVKPAGVPDVFALHGYFSKDTYEGLSETNHGKKFSYQLGVHFDKNKLQQDEVVALGDALIPDRPQDVLGWPVDWQSESGLSTFSLDIKKPGLAPAAFMEKLRRHVSEFARAFVPYGLDGYVVVAGDGRDGGPAYQAAYEHWQSPDAPAAALGSERSRRVSIEHQEMLTRLQRSSVEPFFRPGYLDPPIPPGEARYVGYRVGLRHAVYSEEQTELFIDSLREKIMAADKRVSGIKMGRKGLVLSVRIGVKSKTSGDLEQARQGVLKAVRALAETELPVQFVPSDQL